MIINPNFEITEIADEYIAVPVGTEVLSFNGVVVLSEPTVYLLRKLKEPKSVEDLVDLLIEEYDVDRSDAEKDVNNIVKELLSMGLILK